MDELVEISLSIRSIDAHTVEIKTGERIVTRYTIRLVEVDAGWDVEIAEDNYGGGAGLETVNGSAWPTDDALGGPRWPLPTADAALIVGIGCVVRTIREEIIREDEKSDSEAHYLADEAEDRAEPF